MVEKLKLAPCADNEEHLQRHTDSSSLVIGSKVLSDVSREDIQKISEKMDEEYGKLIEAEGNPGRKVFCLETDRDIGSDAVVPIESLNKNTVFNIVREPENNGGFEVNVALISSKDMPKTNIIHGIYGPYGNSGLGGNYTMIFGDPGEPFPRKLDENADIRAKLDNRRKEEYWQKHVFLITEDELCYAIDKMKEAGLPTKEAEARLKQFKENPKSPIVERCHSSAAKDAIHLGKIKLNNNDDNNHLLEFSRAKTSQNE